MKKFILIPLFLFLFSCTRETTIYIQNANFNNLTELEIDKIDGVGEKKIEILINEMNNGKFKSKNDFQKRMKGKLSPNMILKISDEYNFAIGGDT